MRARSGIPNILQKSPGGSLKIEFLGGALEAFLKRGRILSNRRLNSMAVRLYCHFSGKYSEHIPATKPWQVANGRRDQRRAQLSGVREDNRYALDPRR